MTIKQHINHGAIQKICHLHNGIFHHIHFVTLWQFYCHIPLRYSQKKTTESKKINFCVYMAASAYRVKTKEVENRMFRYHCILRNTCMYKQSLLTK